MVGPETRRYHAKIDQMVGDAKAAEDAGFATAWIPQLPQDFDAMTAVALMGRETSRIELGTAVVPLQIAPSGGARSAGALGAGGVRRAGSASASGRRTTGSSTRCSACPTSSRPSWSRTTSTCSTRCSRDRARSTSRTTTSASTTRSTSPTSPVPVLLAALGPVMLRIAGERTAGTVLWMADERAIAEHVVPRSRRRPRAPAGPRRVSSPAWRSCLCAPNEVEGAIERANERPRSRRVLAELPAAARAGPVRRRRRHVGDRHRSRHRTRGCARSCRRRHHRLLGTHPAAGEAAATRSSRRRGGRASSWRRSRPRSRERMPVPHEVICSGRRSRRWPLDAAARFGDAEAVVDGGRRITFDGAGRRRPPRHRRADRRRASSPASASRSGRRTGTSGWSPRSASSAPAARSSR